MESNLPKGSTQQVHEESLPHDFIEEDLHRTDSFLKKEQSSIKETNSVKNMVIDSYSSPKMESSSIKDLNSFIKMVENYDSLPNKELSSIKDLNSVKDIGTDSIVSATESILVNKTDLSTSLISTHSESIPIKELFSLKNSTGKSSKSKSQIMSGQMSFGKAKTILSHIESADKSGLDSSKSLPYGKIPSRHSDALSKIPSKQTSLYAVNKEMKKITLLTPDNKDVTHEMKQSISNYTRTSPWAKSLSRTCCGPTSSQLSTKADVIKEDFNLKCIPPWAKTLRKVYGMASSEPSEGMTHKDLQDKIKSLMDKHSRLMLVKRGESRKQLILKPSENGDMGAVKMTSKNTRYYMTPIPRDVGDPFLGDKQSSTSSGKDISANLTLDSDDMAVKKKTSRSQAKTEVSNVLKSLYDSKRQSREMDKKDSRKLKQRHTICPKITPSQVREYVNAQTLDSDERKLHEIIKIKKVPNFGTQLSRNPSSKYIINVPKCTKGDGTTVNKIIVKEKHKLRVHSVEDINENITEIIYNKCETQEKLESGYKAEKNVEHDVVPYSKRRKSPIKSRTLEVTAESTPVISNLLKKEKRDKDKILLIQYEEKSKPCKEKSEAEKPTLVSTQLLGIKQPCNDNLKEMYLYGTETDGKTCKENITQVDDVSPTLREKVNMIFQELREMTFKPCAEFEPTEELQQSVGSKSVQYPSILVETDAVSVQAWPEVRSAEVQVNDSVLFSRSQSQLVVPYPTPASLLSEVDKRESIDNLSGKLADIIGESSSEIGAKARPHVSLKPSTALEKDLEVSEIDDSMPVELDEKELSQKSKHSSDVPEMQDKEHLEGIEDEDLRESKETDEGEEKLTQDENEEEIISHDHQEEIISHDRQDEIISQDHQEETILEDEISEQMTEGGKDLVAEVPEALEDEQSLRKEDGGSIIEDDEDSKEDNDFETIEGDKDEEKVGKYQVKEYGIEDGDEELDDNLIAEDGKKNLFLEDIRSYDFDPAQDYELRMVSSSKFFHQRDSLRKLNWTEDILYLEKNTCPQLIKGLAEIAVRQPADPISYLAHWIYKDYHNCECEEQKLVYKEHLEVAKGMLNTKKDEKVVCKKFSIRRYPMKTYSSIVSTTSETSHVVEETVAEET